jgi:hypothetical protein
MISVSVPSVCTSLNGLVVVYGRNGVDSVKCLRSGCGNVVP